MAKKGKHTIEVYKSWCKRCGICVAVCPADVYVAGRDGVPMIAHPTLCIWCGRCETYCPDYAIRLRGRRGW
jgi:2-oxoglutarate ferredoxin oxidoreductase subunit delta